MRKFVYALVLFGWSWLGILGSGYGTLDSQGNIVGDNSPDRNPATSNPNLDGPGSVVAQPSRAQDGGAFTSAPGVPSAGDNFYSYEPPPTHGKRNNADGSVTEWWTQTDENGNTTLTETTTGLPNGGSKTTTTTTGADGKQVDKTETTTTGGNPSKTTTVHNGKVESKSETTVVPSSVGGTTTTTAIYTDEDGDGTVDTDHRIIEVAEDNPMTGGDVSGGSTTAKHQHLEGGKWVDD